MALRKIREFGDEVLNKECKEVTKMTIRTQDGIYHRIPKAFFICLETDCSLIANISASITSATIFFVFYINHSSINSVEFYH